MPLPHRQPDRASAAACPVAGGFAEEADVPDGVLAARSEDADFRHAQRRFRSEIEEVVSVAHRAVNKATVRFIKNYPAHQVGEDQYLVARLREHYEKYGSITGEAETDALQLAAQILQSMEQESGAAVEGTRDAEPVTRAMDIIETSRSSIVLRVRSLKHWVGPYGWFALIVLASAAPSGLLLFLFAMIEPSFVSDRWPIGGIGAGTLFLITFMLLTPSRAKAS